MNIESILTDSIEMPNISDFGDHIKSKLYDICHKTAFFLLNIGASSLK